MQGYDATLKLLLQNPGNFVLRQLLAGTEVIQWLNVELPQVRTQRADLLGCATSGELVHIELQSTNAKDMALRMAEYALAIYRQFERFPHQVVLYVGEPEMAMTASLAAAAFSFSFRLFDIRDLDGDVLLQSPEISDNVLAVLTRLKDQRQAVRQVLAKIAELSSVERPHALAQLLIISGLRKLAPTVTEEIHKMPILDDLLSHEIIGPAILRGREEGRQEGREEGVRTVLHTLIEKRFGAVPDWAEQRMAHLTPAELDQIAIRLLDAANLNSLFTDLE